MKNNRRNEGIVGIVFFRHWVFGAAGAMLILFTSLAPGQEVKEYKVFKVSTKAPAIDGKYTEDEWAGSTWMDEFYGLDLDPNLPEYKGVRVDNIVNIKWRALWDEDYLYVLVTTDKKFLTPSGGLLYDKSATFTPITQDQDSVADFGYGCDDLEFYMVPKWTEDLGNEGMPDFMGPAGYQFCYFPVINGVDENGQPTPSNFGIRDASGPPFFFSWYIGNEANVPQTTVNDPVIPLKFWLPTSDTAYAESVGIKPLGLGSQANEIAGVMDGEVVAKPVVEIAFPFSQFTEKFVMLYFFNYPDPNDPSKTVSSWRMAAANEVYAASGGENVFLTKDAQGHWVKENDRWLFNICSWMDGWYVAHGLNYITWNQMQKGSFLNWPKGILTFSGTTIIDKWMLY
ncbi:MAG: hypothetical protein ACE15F_21645 [bacterium]